MNNEERAVINQLFEAKYGDPDSPAGYGLTATVFLQGGTATKVYSRAIPKNEVFQEAYMLAYVESAGIRTSQVRRVNLEEGFWVVEMSRVQGEPMLRGLFGQLFSCDFAGAAADVERMAEVHASINRADGRAMLPYKRYAASVISGNPALTGAQKTQLLALLDSLPDGTALCHGDFHPNNILVSEDGQWTAIDWPEVTSGSPCADASRTYVNMARFLDLSGFLLRAPDASDTYRDIAAKLAAAKDKPNLMEVYLNKYCQLMGVTREEVLQWVPIQAGMLYGYKEEDLCTFLKPYLP